MGRNLRQFDLDGDGIIGQADLDKVAAAFGSKKGDDRYHRRMDFNHDGLIDIFDLVRIAGHMGQRVEDDEDDDD